MKGAARVYESAKAECPYYKRNGKNIIICESGALEFRSVFDVRKKMDEHCGGDWKACPLAVELDKKYEA